MDEHKPCVTVSPQPERRRVSRFVVLDPLPSGAPLGAVTLEGYETAEFALRDLFPSAADDDVRPDHVREV